MKHGHSADFAPTRSLRAEPPRSDMTRIIRWGCILLVLQFCVFGVWATTVPLRSAVVAPGVIKVLFQTPRPFSISKEDYQVDPRAGERSCGDRQLIARLETAQIEASLKLTRDETVRGSGDGGTACGGTDRGGLDFVPG